LKFDLGHHMRAANLRAACVQAGAGQNL